MKKNYYEILEVDKHASQEIIKKAYNTLAKKYHPDLQPDDTKYIYEEKLKLINEAYETLSDDSKRADYDRSIIDRIEMLEAKINNLSRENELLKMQYKNISRPVQNNIHTQNTHTTAQTTQNIYKQPYTNTTTQQQYNSRNINNKNYKNYYKQANDSFKNAIAIFLTFLILMLLWQLPFVRSFIFNLISIR